MKAKIRPRSPDPTNSNTTLITHFFQGQLVLLPNGDLGMVDLLQSAPVGKIGVRIGSGRGWVVTIERSLLSEAKPASTPHQKGRQCTSHGGS